MNKKAKPTRAQREKQGSAPERHACQCGHVSFSRYAHKTHQAACPDA